MKTKIYITIIVLFLITISCKMFAQSANTTLSNLISPTKVNVNLLPDKDHVRSLGSLNKGWKNLYFDSNVYIGGYPFMIQETSYNTVIGINAYAHATGGGFNAAIGAGTLEYNTTGADNTAVGIGALGSNTTGVNNTAVGLSALIDNVAGEENVAVGAFTLQFNSGNFNTAVGKGALSQLKSGNANVALGDGALSSSTTGSSDVAIGELALSDLNGSTGHCTAVGTEAGVNNKTGGNNTYVGYHAGNTVTSGSSNTIIGYGADITSGSYSNATALGNFATAGGSNHVRIGNSSVTLIGGQVSWSTLSDARIKNNIQQNVPGLQFINLLKPVTYHYDVNKQDNLLDRKTGDWTGKYDIEKIQFTGFIAQDVEAAAKTISYDFSGVNVPKNDKDFYSLRYSDFVVPLVKAVQELSKMNNTKDSIIQIQNNKIDDLENRLAKIETMMNVSSASSFNQEQFIKPAVANLSQNTPNPFSNSTTISYSIPKQFSSAKIIVTDKNGNALKTITLSNNNGSINIDASTLSSGAYQYSLYINGKNY